MGWSCDACTFLNAADGAIVCQICESVRSEAAELVGSIRNATNISSFLVDTRERRAERKPTVQATLFGGIAVEPQNEKIELKKRKPNPLPELEISKQSTLSFAKQPPPTSSAGLTLWRQCASKDIPLSELKIRARKALKFIFGVDKLRMLQPKAVSCALKRKSQLVVMATGGGMYIRRSFTVTNTLTFFHVAHFFSLLSL